MELLNISDDLCLQRPVNRTQAGSSFYRNCTEICTEPRFLFSSVDSFQSCLGYYSNPRDESGYMDTVSTVTRLVNECMQEYCHRPDRTLGGCPYNNLTNYNSSSVVPHLGIADQFSKSGACNVRYSLNPDIGGPGVYVSYLIQIALSWLFCTQLLWVSLRGRKVGSKNVQKRSNAIQKAGIIETMLLEFQEAQCFFTITTQTAGLVATVQSRLFGSTNVVDVMSNNRFLTTTSSLAMLMVSFGYSMLWASKLLSTYISFLTLAALIISAVLFFKSVAIYKLYNNFNIVSDAPPMVGMSIPGLDACGGNKPPNVYCGIIPTDTAYDNTMIWKQFRHNGMTFGVVLIVIVFLLFILMAFNDQYDRSSWSATKRAEGKPISASQRWVRKVIISAGLLWYASLSCIAVVFLAWTKTMMEIDFHEFGIGQTIAVAVWAPVIGKWLHLAAFGMNKYSNARFAFPYKVVNVDKL